MKICICDDEPKLRLALAKVVGRELELCGIDYRIEEYASGEELLKNLAKGEPDILFLDIEMGKVSGMEAARELRRKYKNTVLIFVTAYPDFVFQGYEVHAFHYILKPYKEEKIREVLHKALEEFESLKEQYYRIEQKTGTVRLLVKEIVYFKSDRKKVQAVMKDRTEEFYGKLSDVEAELPWYFVRSHNRYLVNLHFVTKIEGSVCICREEEIPVSRGCRQELLVAFAKKMLN